MTNPATGKDGWHNNYLHAKKIESEVGLPEGAIKPELNGQFTLNLSQLSEDQIRQMAHLWYVLLHTTLPGTEPKRHDIGKSAS